MSINNNQTTYIPFGKEWERKILDLRKTKIVQLYKKVCQENIQLKKLISGEVNGGK